jgi:hypothetical protein
MAYTAIPAKRPPVMSTPGNLPAGEPNRQPVLPNQKQAVLENRIKTFLADENVSPTGPARRPVIEDVKVNCGELLNTLARSFGLPDAKERSFITRVYDAARERKMSFGELLESLDPSEEYRYAPDDRQDAFERQLHLAGIRVKSNPAKGQYADSMQRFETSNLPGSPALFPEFIDRVVREPLIAQDILSQIVAVRTPIVGSDYRSIYINDTAAQRRMVRVAEGTNIPKTTITTSEKSIPVLKYGRGLGASYEYFRRVQIDKFAILMRRMAMQNNLDKANAAMLTLINGDGNSNPATNYNQSTLDTGVVPTYAGFLAFTMKFFPYKCDVLVGNEVSLVKFLTANRPSVDPFQVLALLQNNQMVSQQVRLPQGIYTDVNLILLPDMTDGVIVGLSKDFALEEVTEIGSNIIDVESYAHNQSREMYITENIAYAKLLNEAVRTWTWNA